jgi:hypothetical protein
MAWYRCSCGLLKEETPRIGDTIVSIYHLHRSAGVDGSSAIALMEEVPAPPPEREIPLGTGETSGQRTVLSLESLEAENPTNESPEAEKPSTGRDIPPVEIEEPSSRRDVIPHHIEPAVLPEGRGAGEAGRAKRDLLAGRKIHR